MNIRRDQVKGRDMASHILTAPFGELSQSEAMFRYFVRCIVHLFDLF